MKVTDSPVGIRAIYLNPSETLTQSSAVEAMIAHNLRSRQEIELFVSELFDSLEEHEFEHRHPAV